MTTPVLVALLLSPLWCVPPCKGCGGTLPVWATLALTR